MKNLRTVIFINYVIIAICLGVISLSLIQYESIVQVVFLLAFISMLLLVVNNYMLYGYGKTIKLKEKQEQEEKENVEQLMNIEVATDKEQEEETALARQLEEIDQKQSIEQVLEQKFQKIADLVQLVAALGYFKEGGQLKLKASYALDVESNIQEAPKGEGLMGEVATNGLPVELDIPDQIDLEIISGLGKSKPNFLYILPVYQKKKIVGVVELATFHKLNKRRIEFLIEVFKK